ncbi:ketopantoate reductase family protein [Aestuariirhabdus sp. LZHN29]|uniref:ketopantoate reductase family protein n=1 Tax=Aestuariirhabdus sp. LZHN29 TaxID=3417462 RepID=UPI003CF7EA78
MRVTGAGHGPPPEWIILGAGAMGSLWATRLYQQGVDVRLLARKVATGPLQLRETPDTAPLSCEIPRLTLTDLRDPVHQLLVCCKATDALSAIEQIQGYLAPSARVVLCQNGLGSQQQVIANFPQFDIYCLSTTEGAYLASSNEVVHAGRGESWLGKLHPHPDDLGPELAHSLARSKLPVHHDGNISARLWLKLAINASINGLTALYGCRNGELLYPPRLERMDALSLETQTLYQRLEIPLTHDLQQQVRLIAQSTAENFSSTCQDARRGRPTELAFINGFILAQAAAVDLPMPEHQRLLDELNAKGIK